MEDNGINKINEYFEDADNVKAIAPRTSQKAYRIRKVAIGLLDGYGINQMYEMYANEWGVSLMTMKNYQRVAKKIIGEQIATTETEIRNDLVSKYHYLYQLNMEKGNLIEARRVLDSMTKLTQTFKFDVTSKGNRIETIEIVEFKDNEDTI